MTERYCSVPQTESSYSTPLNNCVASLCFANQISSPNCKCALPYTGLLKFRAPSFSNLGNNTYYTVLEKSLMDSFKLHQLPVDSVNLSHPRKDSSTYLVLNLQVFPFGHDRFNRTGVSSIGFALSNQTFKPPTQFGPFFFIGDAYLNFAGSLITDTELQEKLILLFLLSYCNISLLLFLLIQTKLQDQKNHQTQVLSLELWRVALSSCCYCWALGSMLIAKRREQKRQLNKTILLV